MSWTDWADTIRVKSEESWNGQSATESQTIHETDGNQILVRRMVRIRRRFRSGRQATAYSLGPPFRSRKPVRDWRLGTATRRSVHFRQRALCLGGLEPDRNYRQQPCLQSRISDLYDRRILA